MFQLNGTFEMDRRFVKRDYIRFSPAETSTVINTPNSQKYISIPRDDSVVSLLNRYLDLNFEVIKKADNSRYANGSDILLVTLETRAIFSNFDLATSSRKHFKGISRAHIVSLMYKLLTSAKDTNDLSIVFDQIRNRCRDELTSIKNIEGKYRPKVMVIDVFGFAEHQEKGTYGIGCKLTLTRMKDDAVIDKAAGIADARIEIDLFH